jgi:hypothetical protein
MAGYLGTMKTNGTAGWIAGIRIAVGCLALAAIAGMVYQVSELVADHIHEIGATSAAYQRGATTEVNVYDGLTAATRSAIRS